MLALKALAGQVVAFALTLALRSVVPAESIVGLGWLAVHLGLVAAWTAWMRPPWWWWFIQLGLPIVVVIANGAQLSQGWWLALLIASALVFGGGVLTRVPLYLSSNHACHAVASLLPQGGRLVDLGCGTGTILVALRAIRPDIVASGVESSPLTWLMARLRHRGVAFGSLWTYPIAEADVVYVFLSSEPMPALWRHACTAMRPGALLVSNTFAIPEIKAERVIPLPGRSDAQLFVYRIPAPAT